MTTKNYRQSTSKKLHKARKKIIECYLNEMTVAQIMKTLHVSRHIVKTAINLYVAGGEDALKLQACGKKKGSHQLLTQEQQLEISTIIFTRSPFRSGLNPHRLWDRELVAELIKKKYDIELSERGLANYLKSWGFKLKSTNNHKRCTKEIQKWLAENYLNLKSENAKIYWAFITKKLNLVDNFYVISFVDNQGKIHWIGVKKPFTADKQIAFLKTLASLNKRHQTFLIRSAKGLFKSNKMLEWLNSKKNQHDIKVFPPAQISPDYYDKEPRRFPKRYADDDYDA